MRPPSPHRHHDIRWLRWLRTAAMVVPVRRRVTHTRPTCTARGRCRWYCNIPSWFVFIRHFYSVGGNFTPRTPYATMEVSSIIRAISDDTSWFEGPVPSYNSWVEVLIGGWHLWGTTGDLLQKFTMHWAFWCQKHAIPYTLIRQIPVATIEIRHCRTFIYIPMMNNVARLSVIFSLTSTTNHFPFPQISEKTSILDVW
jgi:hypothetical protein